MMSCDDKTHPKLAGFFIGSFNQEDRLWYWVGKGAQTICDRRPPEVLCAEAPVLGLKHLPICVAQ